MRALSVIVVAACGGNATAPRVSNGAPPVVENREAPKIDETCEPRASGFEPGNRDRFSFEDPLTNLFGFKDSQGNVVIPATYQSVYEFSPGGVAGVVSPKPGAPSAFLFIDLAGKPVARAFAFDNGPDYFQEGYARIVDDAKRMGYLDDTGRIAIAPRYDFAAPFCRGKAQVEIGKTVFFIDRQGNKTTPPPEGPIDYQPSGA